MEMKHLIIFAVIGIVSLLGFNIINGNSREQNREAMVSSTVPESSTVTVAPEPDTSGSSTDITSQPLGEQPKALVDSATSKIDQAQQAEQERMDQISSTQ
ncbi:hypothetical protein IP510_02680 [Psychrobacter sp. NG254]|uniref:hypothetical protein n=1 Tax=Psychrobacter sp. NG254 TaxID=2782003 RepID=UPI0018876C18|nr:hypothetical protein [Psychrobacter sp. NG254]MBF2718790.1 hypothetical protein [Psychrobacter sp. NG254]